MFSFLKDLSGFGSGDSDRKQRKKNMREHRKTRIIRTTTPVNEYDATSENSPIPFSEFDANCPPTPDDKKNDPDWGLTPMRIKRRTTTLPKKVSDPFLIPQAEFHC